MNRALSLSKSTYVIRKLSSPNLISPSLHDPKCFRYSYPLRFFQANHRRVAQTELTSSLSHLCRSTSFSSSSKQSKPSELSPSKEKGKWKRNGTPELMVGFTILALVGIDQYLQSKHKKHRQDIVDELRLAVHVDTLEEKKNDEKNEWIGGARSSSSSLLGEKIALFSCIIMRIPKLFDGNKSLMNVHVGDKVDILEENVGPDGMYHFCRLKRECEGGIGREDNDGDDKNGENANDHYYNFGWFPISCLKRES